MSRRYPVARQLQFQFKGIYPQGEESMNQQQKQQEVPAKKFDVRVGNMTFRGITRKEIAELRQQMNER